MRKLPPLSSAILLVPDAEAWKRCLRPLLGLPTLVRNALFLKRAGIPNIILCASDPKIVREAREKFPVLTGVASSPGELATFLSRGKCSENDEVMTLESDCVLTEKGFEKIVGENPTPRGPRRGPVLLTRGETALLLEEAGDFADFQKEVFPKDEGAEIFRLDVPEGRKEAIHALLNSSRKPTDDFFGYLNRSAALPLSRLFLFLRLGPNLISCLGLALTLLGALLMSRGKDSGFLMGSLVFLLSTILDYSDGVVARLTFRESDFGSWLDSGCDLFYFLSLFGGLFWGMASTHMITPLWMITLLFGIGLSVMVAWFFKWKVFKQEGKFVHTQLRFKVAMRRMTQDKLVRLANFLSVLPRRGVLSYLVLAFALFHQMKAFLIFIALSSHIFWSLGLYVGIKAQREGLLVEEVGKSQPLLERASG